MGLPLIEFMRAMKELGLGMSYAEAQAVFNTIDTDGSGTMEETEFTSGSLPRPPELRHDGEMYALSKGYPALSPKTYAPVRSLNTLVGVGGCIIGINIPLCDPFVWQIVVSANSAPTDRTLLSQ